MDHLVTQKKGHSTRQAKTRKGELKKKEKEKYDRNPQEKGRRG